MRVPIEIAVELMFEVDGNLRMIEATQRMDSSGLSGPDDDLDNGLEQQVVGHLRLLDPEHPDTRFDILGGENLIGRDPDRCRVVLTGPVSRPNL